MGEEIRKGERWYRGGKEVKRIHHFVGAMQTNTADKRHTHSWGLFTPWTDKSALPSGDVSVSQPTSADKVMETQTDAYM